MTNKETSETTGKPVKKKESLLFNLFFNILIPVFLLHKLPKWWEHPDANKYAFAIALIFPTVYFVKDYIDKRKANVISVIGFVSILITGAIGIMQIPNEWLTAKEVGVPLLIMLILIITSYTKHPLMEILVYNDMVFDKERINEKLKENNNEDKLTPVMRKATLLVASSFLISAIINYFLTQYLVVSDPITQATQRTEEIGNLVFWSFVIKIVPCMIMLCVAMWYLFGGITKLTGLSMEEQINEDLREKAAEADKKNDKEQI